MQLFADRFVLGDDNTALDLATADAFELFAIYCFIPALPGVSYYAGEPAT